VVTVFRQEVVPHRGQNTANHGVAINPGFGEDTRQGLPDGETDSLCLNATDSRAIPEANVNAG
jgi:hypothetical protein